MQGADCIVVGAGLCGRVVARYCAEQGKQVLIMEKRPHIGGNLYDYTDENGILAQKYGPHIFHTNNLSLVDYIRRFCDWEFYKVRSVAIINGGFTPCPFSFHTIDSFFPAEKSQSIRQRLLQHYPGVKTATVLELLESEDALIREFAEFLFEKDYRPYTAKQWGVPPEQVDPNVLRRVPVRLSYEDGYFDDAFQALPKGGFTQFIQSVLDHPNITVTLNTDARKHFVLSGDTVRLDGEAFDKPLVYTGTEQNHIIQLRMSPIKRFIKNTKFWLKVCQILYCAGDWRSISICI